LYLIDDHLLDFTLQSYGKSSEIQKKLPFFRTTRIKKMDTLPNIDKVSTTFSILVKVV